MPVSSKVAAPVSQTSNPMPGLKLPRPFVVGKPHRPPLATWEKLREDLFKHSGATPTHKAVMADVDRVIARAEKNGVSPGELLALTSIKSTQHLYFEGGSDSAAWKKLNNWTLEQRYGLSLQKRVDGEFELRAGKGKLGLAGAQKLMDWVRAENTTQGAQALQKAVTKNAARLSPEAKVVLDAFLSKLAK